MLTLPRGRSFNGGYDHAASVRSFHSDIAIDCNSRRAFLDIKCLCVLKKL